MPVGDLDAALAGVERVLLDSSALIAYLNAHEAAHPLAKHLLTRIEAPQDRLRGYYSVMSAMELLIRPIRAGDPQFTYMHTFLAAYPNLTVLPMDFTVAVQAASVRAVSGIRAPDAVIIASGILAGCEAVICNDQQWAGRLATLFPQFRWIYLARYI